MPLPISKQQLNKLGERLAAIDPPDSEDLALLNTALRAYQDLLLTVESELTSLGLSATSRVKTKDVLIEKLRREGSMALARVQDVAGARIVLDGNLREQDKIVEAVRHHFDSWTGKPSRVVDRRLNPSHGYRAVHVIVFPEGVPVEIQVRTELQNYWAQIMESLADRWGRDIRYGGQPMEPARSAIKVSGHSPVPVSRSEIVNDLVAFSRALFMHEADEVYYAEYSTDGLQLEQAIAVWVPDATGDIAIDAPRCYPKMRRQFKKTIGRTYDDKRIAGRIIRRTVPVHRNPTAEWVRERFKECNAAISAGARVMDTKMKARHVELCDILKRLGELVEQGEIR